MRRLVRTFLSGVAIFAVAAAAEGHVTVVSGPGFANTTQEISFGVAHGCAGVDTYSVRVEIPAGVSSVRAETGDFGKATLEQDANGTVTAVTWQKADADLLPVDTNYYKLVLRLKLPDQPFTQLYFPTHQTCKSPDGGTAVEDWIATMPSADGGGPEPAPVVTLVPGRHSSPSRSRR